MTVDIGRPAASWDLDLQVTGPGSTPLLLGGPVAIADIDARYNIGYRRDWITIGLIVHGASPLPGHGPGMMVILTGPASALRLREDGAGHTGLAASMLNLKLRAVRHQSNSGRGRSAILEHVSLPEAVGRALRHRILNNELPADTRLVEANLAAEFGVSRGTIRDAMRSLQSEGLIEIVPRRYSIVTRMSDEDVKDVCYARYVLEDASVVSGFKSREELADGLRQALDEMAAGARLDDLDAVVDGDTKFHALLIDVSGRRRLKDLWSMLNSQMGAVMRSSIERQGISLDEAVDRHRPLLDAVEVGDVHLLRKAIRDHYLTGFSGDEA